MIDAVYLYDADIKEDINDQNMQYQLAWTHLPLRINRLALPVPGRF